MKKRASNKYLLYFYYGKLLPVAKSERGKIHSVFTEQVRKHSQKPNISYEIINRLYPDAKKVELFCRYKRKGWHGWGNEIDCDINLNGFEKAKVRREINLWD